MHTDCAQPYMVTTHDVVVVEQFVSERQNLLGEDGSLSGLLGDNLLCCSLCLHLLSQQRDVFY